MKKPKVYLVGAGPGDPDLITLKGLKILKQADVILYDYLVDKRILEYANSDAELICADNLDKEKYKNGFTKRQDLINKLLVNKAQRGKKVLRLKNGDPFIFARANEEISCLIKHKIEFSVVPGITAASAAACLGGIPLTSRDSASSVTLVTGHEVPGKRESFINWESIAAGGTIVLYMAVANISKIAKKLISSGKDKGTPVAVISNVSKINQKIVIGNLKNITEKLKKEKIHPPAVIIIGKVVSKHNKFNWFKKAKKVLFTGLSSERFYEKGIIFHIPLIEIIPLDDYSNIDSLIRKLGMFDWIVFSSRYGVLYFFQRLFKLGYDTRSLKGIKIAAVGRSTAGKLKEFGVVAELVPGAESSRGLIRKFKKIDIKEKNILLPRSDIRDKGLAEGLKKQGANVYSSIVYRNIMPEALPDMDLTFFDEIIFTSPSTVRNFKKRYKRLDKKIKVTCIGDVTLREAKRCRLLG